MRVSPLALAVLALSLTHCEQIIGADFSAPAETVPANPKTGGVNPDPPRYPDANAFCSAFAEALCQPTVADACWSDGACVAATTAACLQRIGSNRGYLNEAYADGCISATLALGKGGRADTKSQRQPDCIRAFGVHAAADDPCSSDADCTNTPSSENLRCVVADDKTYRCKAIPSSSTKDEGDACKNQVCNSATYCNASAPTPLCVKRIESGSCASFKGACASGHACINGACQRTSPPQVTCTSNDAVCSPTSTCEKEDPKCSTSSCYKTCVLNCTQDAECGLETFCIKGKCRESLELKVDPPDGCEALVADPLLGAF